MGDLWKRLSERQKRFFGWLALATILGIAILVLQPAPQKVVVTPSPQQPEAMGRHALENYWEGELTTIINSMLGTKRNQVFLTLERGTKLNIAQNLTEEERRTAEGGLELRRTVTQVILRNDGERRETPLILEELEPVVRGVVVVLDHEPQVHLRLQVAQAVATVLQVPMYRIEVLFKQ